MWAHGSAWHTGDALGVRPMGGRGIQRVKFCSLRYKSFVMLSSSQIVNHIRIVS